MADEMALAVAGDGDNKISLAEIVKSLQLPEGYNLDNLKPIITGGADHYWPAEPGMLLCGVLLEVNERPTSLVINGQAQNARFYTIELTRRAMAMTMDGELVELSAGKSISLLERTMLRKLEGSLGKEVIIHCDGKGKTKRGQDLWYYRAWEVGQVAASPRIGAA